MKRETRHDLFMLGACITLFTTILFYTAWKIDHMKQVRAGMECVTCEGSE